MSKLGDLKNGMYTVGTGMSNAANGMMGFVGMIDHQILDINLAIGDTADNKDEDMIQALQLAKNAVRDAALNLNEAATKVKEWVNNA